MVETKSLWLSPNQFGQTKTVLVTLKDKALHNLQKHQSKNVSNVRLFFDFVTVLTITNWGQIVQCDLIDIEASQVLRLDK